MLQYHAWVEYMCSFYWYWSSSLSGEFGIVYKGYIKKGDTNSLDEYLAIKTLKGACTHTISLIYSRYSTKSCWYGLLFILHHAAGFYDHSMVRDMLKECLRMSTFDHLHVLTLKGVCLDGGPAPYIIMPFMANGSLLAYLRKNIKNLVVSNESNDDVSIG